MLYEFRHFNKVRNDKPQNAILYRNELSKKLKKQN